MFEEHPKSRKQGHIENVVQLPGSLGDPWSISVLPVQVGHFLWPG